MGVDVGARALEGVGALSHRVEIAGAHRLQDLLEALVAARDEGVDQLALELGIAAGELVQRIHVDIVQRFLVAQVPAQAIRELRRHDGFADVGVHAGGEAVIAILAHDIRGERDDGQALAEAFLALPLTDAGGGGEAVHYRHLAVHQHRIDAALGDAIQGLGAIVGEDHVGG